MLSGKLGKPARETEKKPPFGDDLPEPFVGVIPFFARGSGDDFLAVDVARARRRSNSSVGMVSMLLRSQSDGTVRSGPVGCVASETYMFFGKLQDVQ